MRSRESARMANDPAPGAPGPALHTIVLPTFLLDHEVGLGQLLKRATSSVGARPCVLCEQRAARLDQWLRFVPGARGRSSRPGDRPSV
jgi:hypothetical protein